MFNAISLNNTLFGLYIAVIIISLWPLFLFLTKLYPTFFKNTNEKHLVYHLQRRCSKRNHNEKFSDMLNMIYLSYLCAQIDVGFHTLNRIVVGTKTLN